MAIFLNDDFTGTSGTLLQNHAPDLGGTWTKFFTESADPSLSLDGAGNLGATSRYAAYYYNTANPSVPNVTLYGGMQTGTSGRAFYILRWVDGGTHYKVVVMQSSIELYRVNFAGGTGNTLVAQAATASNVDPVFIKTDIVDNTIKVYRAGVLVIDFVDTDPSKIIAPGICGVAADVGVKFFKLTGETLSTVSTGKLIVPGVATASFTGVGLQTKAAALAATGTSTAAYNGVTFHTGYANMPGSGGLSFHGLTIQIAPASAAMIGLAGTALHGGSTRESTYGMSAAGAAAFVSTTLPAFTGEWFASGSSGAGFTGSALKASRLDAAGRTFTDLNGRGIQFGRTTWNVTVEKSQATFVRGPMTVPVRWGMHGTSAAGFVSITPSIATWGASGTSTLFYRGSSLRAARLTGGGQAGSTLVATRIVGTHWTAEGLSDAAFAVDLHLPPFTPATIRTVVLDPESRFYGSVGTGRIVLLSKLDRIVVLDALDRTLELPRINRYARLDGLGSRTVIAKEDTAMRWASIKDPDDILDYTVDWTNRMAADDVIVTSTFDVVSGTITIDRTEIVGDVKTVAWISGGASGETASVHNRVVTQGGRQMDQTLQLQVKMR